MASIDPTVSRLKKKTSKINDRIETKCSSYLIERVDTDADEKKQK